MLLTVPDKRFQIRTLPIIWNLSLSIIFLGFLIQKHLWIFLGMIILEDYKEKINRETYKCQRSPQGCLAQS